MKILCFHPALAPYRVDFFNLLARYAKLKIIFLQDNLLNQKFDQNRLIHKLEAPFEIWNGCSIKGQHFRFGLSRIIRRENPDVILGYESGLMTVQIILWKILHPWRHVRLWTMLDDSPEQVRSRRGLRRTVRDWVMRNVDKVIVPSQTAAESYAASRLRQNLFSVLPIIHDVDSMRRNASKVYALGKAWRHDNCPAGWKRVIVFVGRLAKEKNLHWLIERLGDLSQSTGLVVVGDGLLGADLESYVTRLGIGNRVLFVGRKEGDELYSIMAGSDVLALASTSEPFGAVVAEGLAWGTPCLVSDRCGAASIIENGYNGYVFSCNDVTSFQNAIMRLPSRKNHSLLKVNLEDAVKMLVFKGRIHD